MAQYSLVILLALIAAVIAWGVIDNRRMDREGSRARKQAEADAAAQDLNTEKKQRIRRLG